MNFLNQGSNHAPFGWKLNVVLDSSFSHFVVFYSKLYMSFLSLLTSFFVPLTYLGYCLGVSVRDDSPISLVMGVQMLLKIYTFHLQCFHFFIKRITFLLFKILSSLGLLFRGKKYNVIRRRIDSYSYRHPASIDILLLGTILFAAAVLLLPTIVVYFVVVWVFYFASFVAPNKICDFIGKFSMKTRKHSVGLEKQEGKISIF